MNRSQSVYRMAIGALLIAVGIIIPIFMPPPFKIYLPPMSFTLASHVAIFLAMFISPAVALLVAAGTTVGFVLSGLPVDVWLRALTHIVWAFLGALYLKKHVDTLQRPIQSALFCLVIGVGHAALELVVVFSLFFGGLETMVVKFQSSGFLMIFLLVGVGTLVHSCVDYAISLVVWQSVRRLSGVKATAAAR